MIKYRFGSQDSVDKDVYYVFNTLPSFSECQQFCSADITENRNIITIDNGVVTNCFKGTIDEVNNGLFYTYSLHQQEYPLLVNQLVERDILIKVIRVVRCLLSYCSRTQYRTSVKSALTSDSWYARLTALKNIDFNAIQDYGKNSREEVLKVFAFQLGQILGLMQKYELYTKGDIANIFQFLFSYLYRIPNTDMYAIIEYINIFIDRIEKYSVIETNGICIFNDFDKSINLRNEKYI